MNIQKINKNKMEYKVYKKISNYLRVHIIIRCFLGSVLAVVALVPLLLPFPGSFPVWVLMLILALLTVVPGKKIRHVIKIRKWFMYLVKNFHRKTIIRHKMRDFSSHIKEILNDKNDRRIQRLSRLKSLKKLKK